MNKELIDKLGIALKTVEEQMQQSDIYKALIEANVKPHRAFLLSLTFTICEISASIEKQNIYH